MQIFRDDSRRRWRRLKVVSGLLTVIGVVVAIIFVRTLEPRPAAVLAAPASSQALDLAGLRKKAIDAAPPREHVVVSPAIAAIAPAAKAGADDGGAPIRMASVDATELEGLRSIEQHGQLLTHLAVEGLHLRDPEGGIVGQVPDDLLAIAKEKKLAILEVVDDVRDEVPHPEEVTALGRDRGLARRFASILASKLKADGAQGTILSLGEDDADLDGTLRAAVVEEVFAKLKPDGFVVGVRFEGRFVPEALVRQAKIADLVEVRAYGGLDPHSSPAPLAPRAWVAKTIEAASKLVPAKKLIIAFGTRAGGWPVHGDLSAAGTGRELQWGEVVARARVAKSAPVWDPKSGNLVVALQGATGIGAAAQSQHPSEDEGRVGMIAWMPDAATVVDGMVALDAHGLRHVAIGTVGGEDPRIWRVLAATRDDRAAIREALAILPAPTEPQVIGDGVVPRVDFTQQDGAATIEFGAGGHIESERYDVIPAGPTVIRRGEVPAKTIVLTFDDGPDADWTPKVLDALKQEGVKATFFAVGARAEREPELLRRIVAEGHELGNHSFSHPDLGKISDERADFEINSTNRLFEALTGRGTFLFRPPFRSDGQATVKEDLIAIENGARNGMMSITSNVDALDWARPAPDVLVDYLLRRVDHFGGGMVLLHDGGGDRSNTVVALRPLLQQLRAKGYTFKQVHEILGEPSIETVNPPAQKKLTDTIGRVVWSAGTWFLRAMTGLAIFALALGLFRFAALTLGALLDVIGEWRDRQAIRRTSRLPQHGAVSVVIPAYNEAKVIERTILSVLASRGVEVEVLVMDDGSTDATPEVVSQAFYFEPRVKLHRLKNGGKARALNIGFELASHEIVIALDADTIFLPDTIVELARKFDNPRVAAVAGRAAVGNTQHFVARWQALEYVIGQAIERRAWHLLGVVSVVPGAVGAWRRRPVLERGGFGTDTLAEDCDLTIELQCAGWKVGYAPNAVALTEAPETVQALLKQRFRWCFGVLQTVWKHRRAMLRPPRKNPVIGLLLLPCILACHIATPFLAPLADMAALFAIVLGHGRAVVPYAIALLVAELTLTLLAMRMDRARFSLMWDWLVNRAVYRWFLFAALCRAVMAALRGGAVGWGKLMRTGTVEAPALGVASKGDQQEVKVTA